MGHFVEYWNKLWLPLLARPFMLNKPPIKVAFQTTKECNLSCIHCSSLKDALSAKNLDTEECKNLFLDLKKLGTVIFILTGGEPLLRPDIFELVEYCSRINLYVGVATNGTLLTREKALKLKELGLNWFHLSLDGQDALAHELLRGKGSFQDTIKGIKNAVSTGLPVNITTTVTKANKDLLEEILDLMVSLKVRQWSPNLLVPCGSAKKIYTEEAITNKKTALEFVETIYSLEQKFKGRVNIYMHDPQFYSACLLLKKETGFFRKAMLKFRGGCAAMNGLTLYIGQDGAVKPCSYFPEFLPGENVRDKRIKEIYFKNEFLKGLRNKRNLKGKCARCRLLCVCGGCRSRAYVLTGDALAQDDSCPFF